MDQQWCDIKGTLNKIHPGCIKKSPPSGSDPDSPLIMLLTRHMGLFHSHSQLCLYEVLYSFLICLRSLLVLQTALCPLFLKFFLRCPYVDWPLGLMGKDHGTHPAAELQEAAKQCRANE